MLICNIFLPLSKGDLDYYGVLIRTLDSRLLMGCVMRSGEVASSGYLVPASSGLET